MARLRISEGMRAFNLKRPEGTDKMTLARLAPIVFEGEDITDELGLKYLSAWNNDAEAKTTPRPKVTHIARIADKLGMQQSALVEA